MSDFEFHKPTGKDETEPGYVYHATNVERAHDIADAGHLNVHRPWHGTDQREWPDGATEKRAYFSRKAHIVHSFAPEEGHSAVLRVRDAAHPFKDARGTGDTYATKKIPAKHIEVRHAEGAWHPISKLATKKEESMARQPLLIEMDTDIRAAERRHQAEPGDTGSAARYARLLRRAGRHRDARGVEMAPHIERFQKAHDEHERLGNRHNNTDEKKSEYARAYRELSASHGNLHRETQAAQERDGEKPDRTEVLHHLKGPAHSAPHKEHQRFVSHLNMLAAPDGHWGTISDRASAKAVARRVRQHYPKATSRITVGQGYNHGHQRGGGKPTNRSYFVHVDDFGTHEKRKPQFAIQRVGTRGREGRSLQAVAEEFGPLLDWMADRWKGRTSEPPKPRAGAGRFHEFERRRQRNTGGPKRDEPSYWGLEPNKRLHQGLDLARELLLLDHHKPG